MSGNREADSLDLAADVLVVGGGPAGCWAAIAAIETGASVILVDKGRVGTSGATAAANTAVIDVSRSGPARAAVIERRLARGFGLARGDWDVLARPNHTAVFYMGVAQLPRILSRLRAAGAAADQPAVIIERATLPDERVLSGTVATLETLARNARVVAPALLIVGKVAAFARPGVAARTMQPEVSLSTAPEQVHA